MELLDIIIWILVLIVIIVNIFLYLEDPTDPAAYDGEDLEEEAELLAERYNIGIEDARLMAKYGEVE